MIKKLFIIFWLVSVLSFLETKSILALERNFYPDLLETIVSGKTTKQEAITLLGKPTKDFHSFGKDILWYLALDDVSFHTVVFKNGVASLVTIHMTPEHAENLKSYGLPDKTTYNFYRYDTKTYIFSQQGLALTADPEGKILVKQKFTPGSIDVFLSEWGNEFPEVNPYYEGKTEASPSPLPPKPRLGIIGQVKNFFINLIEAFKGFIKLIPVF